MALTTHEIFHLDAILAEIIDNKLQPVDIKKKLAESKNIKQNKYESYLDAIKIEVDNIKSSDLFPILDKTSDIHDFLEKE
jgi:hypothetical protein